ncbi:hypothetical protein Bca4012_058789 [Brassica carinata]
MASGSRRTALIWRVGWDRPHSRNRTRHMASGLGQTALAKWLVSWDRPHSQYGEWARTDRTRHMASGSRRTALSIWRAGRDVGSVLKGEQSGLAIWRPGSFILRPGSCIWRPGSRVLFSS